MHSSSSREVIVLAVEATLHPRRRQVLFRGMTSEGLSASDSGSVGFSGATCGAGTGARGGGTPFASTLGTLFGALSGLMTGAVTGVSSTVECLPFVHGSRARNSSKLRTRGLQHDQPGKRASATRVAAMEIAKGWGRLHPTLGAFVEIGGSRVIETIF